MSRGIFGWDLPPGVTTRDIDRAAGALDDMEECDACAGKGCEDCNHMGYVLGDIESDDYGTPCPTCPKRGRSEPNLIDLTTGECSACDADRAKDCAAASDEDRERWADMAMEPRYPR